MKEKIHKTVVFTGYKCNNRCVFCMEQDKRDLPPRGTKEVKEEIGAARQRGADYLELIGGEMTIRSDFVELLKFANTLGFSTIMISTNGRMFSYEKFTRNALRAGLTDIVFSIHGHNAELHDSLTQSEGSFEQLREGVENVKRTKEEEDLEIQLGSNTTIVKPNLDSLPEIGRLIKKLGIRNSEFIFVDPNEGGANKNFHELVPKISNAAPVIKECLQIGTDFPHWDVRYVPLCYFVDFLDQVSEIKEVNTFETEHIAQDFEDYNAEKNREAVGREKAKVCENCVLDDFCEGIWRTYAQKYGTEELNPPKESEINFDDLSEILEQ